MIDILKRAVPYSKFNVFIGWPIAGILLLIFSFINFNNWGATTSTIAVIISLFLIIYGSWAVKRAWARM